jgi:hypothetical protein
LTASRVLRAAALACALAVVLVVAGCRTRSQAPPPLSTPSARLLVTADFGATPLLERRVKPDQSVMAALRGAVTVKTAYAGAFVSEMFGRRSDLGARRDWFYLVDGVTADVGARDYRLRAGETAWWDYRPWGGQMDVAGAVGLWPEPFVHGYGGPPAGVSADPPLAAALRAAGARLVTGPARWRVEVGSDAELRRRDPAWERAERDPTAAGLTAAVEHGAVTALRPDGSGRSPVPGSRALAALVAVGARPGDGAAMVVAGLDAAAARAAARRIARDPGVLRGRYAVTFDGRGNPVRAAGRVGP